MKTLLTKLTFLLLLATGLVSANIIVSTKDAIARYRNSACTREEIIPNAHFGRYIPPYRSSNRGDQDFKGHGPDIEVDVRIYPDRSRKRLLASVSMIAVETRPDWTTARGWEEREIFFTKSGWEISDILSDTRSQYRYTDNDHADDVFTLSSGELVRQFRFIGDRKGGDAGVSTSVWVYFNPIRLMLRKNRC